MKFRDVMHGRVLLGRLEKGEDLLEAFTRFARCHQIRLGIITAIGALQAARIALYDQKSFKYTTWEINEESEIDNLSGNISLKDGEVFCHLHATLTMPDGRTIGGHVCEGCIVFACEFIVQEIIGEDFIRTPDKDTGLSLWQL